MSWLPVAVTTAPASEPVTLTEAKTHCSVDGSDRDDELNSMIAAARAFVEDYTGQKIITQTVQLSCSSFDDLAELPVAPIQSVTSITYLDGEGVSQTLSTDVYEAVLTGISPHIRLKVGQSFPSVRTASNAITVTAVAGFGDAEDVPSPMLHAMKRLIGIWFEQREVIDGFDDVTRNLLSNYRKF